MRTLPLVALAAFGAFTAYVLWEIGYFGILQAGMASVGAWQIFIDLVIMSCVAMGFIWRDAQRKGRAFWPYFAITVVAGSFGPLLYLMLTPARGERAATQA